MRILCIAKDSHFINKKKKKSVSVIFMFEILTNPYLTMSLILNNWSQISDYIVKVTVQLWYIQKFNQL